jgi:hypothetical protein
MFDIRKNLSIALFRIKKSFWCFFRTWWNVDDENDCLNEIDDDSRAFKSKRFVSFEKSKMNFWKNWFEMIDENNLKEKL